MIDRIVRKNYNEWVIVFFDKPSVTIRSSGNAWALIDWMINGRNYLY